MTGTPVPMLFSDAGKAMKLALIGLAAGSFLLAPQAMARSFELSDSYSAAADVLPGYYACVSGLDFHDFTIEIDISVDGEYALRGQPGSGLIHVESDGGMEFADGPLQSDDTATTYAMSAVRLSDGVRVIIVRYDFGGTVTDDYCALLT